MNCTYSEQVTDAYLSGEIENPEWRTHLSRCPECAAKLAAESDFDLVIKHAVNEERLHTRQLEAHVRNAIRNSSPWKSPVMVMVRYSVAATVIFATLLVATFGYAKGRMDLSATCGDAVDDHQEEVINKAPRKWRSDDKDVQALAQKMVGDPQIAQRVTPPGYYLVGARICVLHGKRYMHLDYSDGANQVSLFLRHRENQAVTARVLGWFHNNAPAAETIEGFSVGSVEKHDVALVMVSPSPVPEVHKFVEEAANRL
jgi:anti-sigma factor RsiW